MKGNGDLPGRDEYIDLVFGSSGILAGEWANYRPRAGQVALARAVDKAVANRTHLLAEGPTGTGKSLAYAVPATYYAALEGQTIVIATANIALQEQLVKKDLPLLARLLPWPFTFELAKGRNNYLCVSRYYEHQANAQRALFREQGGGGAGKRHLEIVQQWAEQEIAKGIEGGATGDVSQLPIEPNQEVWREFSVGPDECKKKKCRFAPECFALEAQERMKRVSIVVTNYHMLMADLAVYAETGLDKVLPPWDSAILDEAHKAADVARDFFGFKITNDAARRAVRKLKRDAQSRGAIDPTNASGDLALAERVERASTQMFYALQAIRQNKERYNTRLRYPLIGESHAIDPRTTKGEQEVVADLLESLGMLNEVLARRVEATDGMPDQQAEWENDAVAAGRLLQRYKRAFSLEGSESVYFIEEEGNQEDKRGVRISLSSRLVSVGSVLELVLFGHTKNSGHGADDLIIGPQSSVVCTSATLSADRSFDFAAKELGATKYDEIIAESPFDWPNQALFIVPEGMPEPNDEKFPDAVAAAFNEIVDMAGGKTLGLFTSRRVLNHVYDKAIGRGYRILKQGDAPRTKLIEEFARDVSSVLLGLESFWAGVDVPGEALSVVVIDRLPFPTPDDPVADVISKRDKNWFFNFSVPRSIIQFKQGFGRAVRTLKDRAVIVCFDSRLTSKRYGKQFLRSLPNCPKSTKLGSIPDWLAVKLEEPAPAPLPSDPFGGIEIEDDGAETFSAPESSQVDPFDGVDESIERADPTKVRTPDGSINNCAIANGDDEEKCQICRGLCPDKSRIIKRELEKLDARSAAPVIDSKARHFPVTDPELDAPDGAEMDGYVRRGAQWVREAAPPDPFEDVLDDEIPF